MNQAVALRAGGSALLPIYPTSIEEVYRLSKMALTAGMLKPQKTGYGDNAVYEDADAVLARGTMIIMQGMELGIPPMQSVQLLAMINGRIVAHSEAVPGLLLSKGFKLSETWTGKPMADDWTCTIELTRPDGQKFKGSFSVADAKQAQLWDQAATKTSFGKTKPNDAAWFRYPQRMLKARALGFVGKDGGADALKGLMVREEMEDMIRLDQARDITPAKAPALEMPDDDEVPPKQIAEPAPAEEPDEPLADADGFLEKLAEDLALCTSVEELKEITDANADMVARLPKEHRVKAAKMLADAAE
jgi:hypothetical protein